MQRKAFPRLAFSLCLAILVGLSARNVSAQTPWTSATYPNPVSDPDRCHALGIASTACDPDGVLSKQGFQFLDSILKDVIVGKQPYSQSSCSTDSKAPGYKVAVAVMRRMAMSPGSRDAASTARRFAKDLHDKWGVGEASCSNGVLLLMSLDDRQVYISTGKAARAKLTDGYAATIIDSMKPNLRRGDYDGAIQQAIVDIGLVLAGSVPKEPAQKSSGGGGWLGLGIFMGFAGLLLSGFVKNFQQNRQSRRCRSILDKLKRDQAQALRQHRFPATTCPICLEDIQPPQGPCPSGVPGPSGSDGSGPSSSSSRHQAHDGCDDADAAAGAGSSSSPSAPLLGSSDSGEAGGEPGRKRPALTLPCGHTFCEECIDRWVQGKNTCPICRKPLDREAPPPSKMAEQQQQQQQQQRRWQFDQNMIAAEMAFRLANLQQMYPRQINRDMLDNWTNQAHQGALIDWNDQRALALDTAAHCHTFHSQDTGMSAFGGGSSFGGGGSGGSW